MTSFGSIAPAAGGASPTRGYAPTGNAAMFWAMAYKLSDTLMLLSEAGAMERLARAPLTAPQLAAAMRWQAGPLAKLLDLLVTVGVLEKLDVTYTVPAATQAVLPVVRMEAQVRRWHAGNRSTETVLQAGVGADPLAQIADPDFVANYQRAMAASARALALHVYRYAGLRRDGQVLDIGGADGALAEQLGAFFPQTNYCVIDRPAVRAHFEQRMAGDAGAKRCRFVADDVTRPEALLREAEAASGAIISNVLHLLSGRQIRELLSALRTALMRGARVVVYDQFLDPTQFSAADLMVVDWVNLGSEFELNEQDMSALLLELGFVNVSSRRFPLIPGALVCATVP